jgi:hypothetical protein
LSNGKTRDPARGACEFSSGAPRRRCFRSLYDLTMPLEDLREAHREISFRDPRPPQEIQFQLERTLVTLFRVNYQGARLSFHGATKLAGCPYEFDLRFDAALSQTNCYSLSIGACWANFAADYSDYFRRAFDSWFQFWTKPFEQAAQPDPAEWSAERYRSLAEQAMAAESHLIDVGCVQQAILSEMRRGRYFSDVHKEGGTTIRWLDSRFVRADYGESDATETFDDEASFLEFLRRFYFMETSKAVYPEKVPELDAWKLILRLLNR